MIFEEATKLDKADPLAPYQNQFNKPKNVIYLDGNSLGMMPKDIPQLTNEVVTEQWGMELIGGWNNHWLDLNERLEHKLAKLIHANKAEVFVGDSTSINLYKLAKALIQTNQFSNNLVSDNLNFPSDRYILKGLTDYSPELNYHEIEFNTSDQADIKVIESYLKKHRGVYCLSLSTYLSAYVYPVDELNKLALENGSIIIWDLSHAIGAIEIDVKESSMLAAVGCTYKHLNGGPGSPGFLYIDEELSNSVITPIQGWFGHKDTFGFNDNYQKGPGSMQFKVGTPNILSLAATEAGIDITLDASMLAIREKCLKMAKFIYKFVGDELSQHGVKVIGPANESQRGGHITLHHPESWRICKILQTNCAPKIITDFRPESFLRVAITPLYTSFTEIAVFLDNLKTIMESKSYKNIDDTRPEVT